MTAIASYLTKNLILTIPLSMILGLAYGLIVDPSHLKVLIMPLTFLMVYPMMINLRFGKILEGGDLRLQALTHGLNFLVIPFVALLLGSLFFAGQPFLILGLFLVSLLPTSGMTISYTGLSRGNTESAVKMTVVGLIAGSLLAPVYLQLFLGATINIDMVGIMAKIGLIVFLPLAAGYVTQQLLIKRHGKEVFFKEIGAKYGPFSTFGVTGVVLVATALNARTIVQDPVLLPSILLPLIVVYAINYTMSVVLGKMLLSRDDAIAMLYGSVMRNLSVALAVVINSFGEDGASAALIISLAYIVQVQSAAWFVKYTDRIYGPKQAAAKV